MILFLNLFLGSRSDVFKGSPKIRKWMWRKLVQLRNVLKLVMITRNVFYGSTIEKKQRIAKLLCSEASLLIFLVFQNL